MSLFLSTLQSFYAEGTRERKRGIFNTVATELQRTFHLEIILLFTSSSYCWDGDQIPSTAYHILHKLDPISFPQINYLISNIRLKSSTRGHPLLHELVRLAGPKIETQMYEPRLRTVEIAEDEKLVYTEGINNNEIPRLRKLTLDEILRPPTYNIDGIPHLPKLIDEMGIQVGKGVIEEWRKDHDLILEEKPPVVEIKY